MDYKAIADALAARYAPAAVVPPNGYPNIRLATAEPPNAIAQSPSVVVWPNRGDVITEANQRKDSAAEFLVNFYYAKHEGDVPRESAALLRWLGVLLGQLHGQMKLGQAGIGVDKALVVAWSIGALSYAGVTYDGITITVHVWTTETVVLVP